MANSIFITPFGGTIQGPITINGGGLSFSPDDTVNIGGSNATLRPQNIFAATSVEVGSNGTTVQDVGYGAKPTGLFYWSGRAIVSSPADSQWKVTNAAATTAVTLTVPAGLLNTIPVVVAKGRATAQAAANPSISTFTVGAADGSFEVSANVNVTTATAHSFSVTCAYTDESNAARTLTMGFIQLSGATLITIITNVTGAGPYESNVCHIRCKAATTITFATTGTFTTVVYNAEGMIKQVA